MFKKLSESEGNVAGYQMIGQITKDDYQALVPEVEALVEQAGDIRLLLDMEQFEGKKGSGPGPGYGNNFTVYSVKEATLGSIL